MSKGKHLQVGDFHLLLVQYGRKDGLYRVECNCGYKSKLVSFPGLAEQAGGAHMKGKHGRG